MDVVVTLSAGDVKLFVSQTMRDPRKEHRQSVSLLVVGDVNRKGGLQSLGPGPSYCIKTCLQNCRSRAQLWFLWLHPSAQMAALGLGLSWDLLS